MLRTLRSRRRNRYGSQLCALTAALLLLLSVSLLYSHVSPVRRSPPADSGTFDPFSSDDPLLQDPDVNLHVTTSSSADDRIDEIDVFDDEGGSKLSNEEELLRNLDSESEETDQQLSADSSSSSYFFDHVSGVIRRAFDRRSIDEIDRWDYQASVFDVGLGLVEDRSKVAFASDDVPVNEEVRRKVVQISGIEDALMLKLGSRDSPLREGWGPWFDAKSDFLRKDKMFRSNLDALNPLNNPLLQDPDGVGVTGLTRGDKLMQKGLLIDMKKYPFLGKKPLGVSDVGLEGDHGNRLAKRRISANKTGSSESVISQKDVAGYREAEIEHRTLDSDVNKVPISRKSRPQRVGLLGDGFNGVDDGSSRSNVNYVESSVDKMVEEGLQEVGNSIGKSKSESKGSLHAGRGRWGYFPGLPPYLSFSNFMDSFFRQFKCSLRVFMVWNSPSWMYTIRFQKGLESLLFHHPDACVVIFSETIELDFFKEFQKDGYKIAVVMPNLEELLKDTPTSMFASVWYEWRSTRYYPTHYSELIRLAALYKYGGIYLDCDVIVLRPLSLFVNSVGVEDLLPRRLNGAVMAFRKHSPFMMDCLSEFYSTYDDTLQRWNGADLLTRVAGNFSSKAETLNAPQELKLQQLPVFFPIRSHDIQRYFSAPANDSEKATQDAFFRKILDESYTFHYWNSLTYALVPEPDSLVARILNHHCIRCLEVL